MAGWSLRHPKRSSASRRDRNAVEDPRFARVASKATPATSSQKLRRGNGLRSESKDERPGSRPPRRGQTIGRSVDTCNGASITTRDIDEAARPQRSPERRRGHARAAGGAVGIVTRMCRDAGSSPVARWRPCAIEPDRPGARVRGRTAQTSLPCDRLGLSSTDVKQRQLVLCELTLPQANVYLVQSVDERRESDPRFFSSGSGPAIGGYVRQRHIQQETSLCLDAVVP